MKETQSEDKKREQKSCIDRILCSHYNTIPGCRITKRRMRSFYNVNCKPLPFKTILITNNSTKDKVLKV